MFTVFSDRIFVGFTWCWSPFMKLGIHQGSACDRWLYFFCCLWIRWLRDKIWSLEREMKGKKRKGERREKRGKSLGERKESKKQWLKLLCYLQLLENKIWAYFGILYGEKTKSHQFRSQLSILLYVILYNHKYWNLHGVFWIFFCFKIEFSHTFPRWRAGLLGLILYLTFLDSPKLYLTFGICSFPFLECNRK